MKMPGGPRRPLARVHPDECSHPKVVRVGYSLPSGDTFNATVCRVCDLMFDVERKRVSASG